MALMTKAKHKEFVHTGVVPKSQWVLSTIYIDYVFEVSVAKVCVFEVSFFEVGLRSIGGSTFDKVV